MATKIETIKKGNDQIAPRTKVEAITDSNNVALSTTLGNITNKLDGIESNAQVNVLEGVQVDGSDLPISNKKVNIPNATYNETQKNYGLVAIGDGYGCLTISNDYLVVRKASDYNITNRHSTVVLDPSRINHAVKCALTDSFGIGTGTGGRAPLTDTEKQKAWGVFSIIKTTMDSVAVCNAQYYLGEQSSVSITMPTSALEGQDILVVFSSGATPCTLTCDLQGFSFVPKANKTSYIKFTCVDSVNMNWIVETKEG